MKLKQFFKINWKYAIGEILLIFIGITLAIWFDNYKENNKNKKRELVLLNELLKDEKENYIELNEDLNYFYQAREGCEYVLDHIENNKPVSDSIGIYFGRIQISPIIQLQKSTYYTIQSIGWHIVSNDSLRSEIIFLYDRLYDALEELVHKRDFTYIRDYIVPLYNMHFNSIDNMPVNYEALINDMIVKNTVRKSKYLKEEIIRFTQRRIDKNIKVQELIKEEIKRLEM